MNSRRLSIVVALGLMLAACTSAGSGPSATPSGSNDSASPGAQRLAVTLADNMTIAPASMTVRTGVPMTFVVTNSGAIAHEFYLGDDAAQNAHETEMASMGGMHDEPQGISVDPGTTKELTYTFAAAGSSLAGCHVPGHYGGGMKANITITP